LAALETRALCVRLRWFRSVIKSLVGVPPDRRFCAADRNEMVATG
jgi:hypothetical protein